MLFEAALILDQGGSTSLYFWERGPIDSQPLNGYKPLIAIIFFQTLQSSVSLEKLANLFERKMIKIQMHW